MYRGYVKVWRKIADAGWLQNHKLCALWLWCLIKASHQEYEIIVGCQKVKLLPGEFVFGLNAASKDLKLSIQSIRTLIGFLKTSQNLTVKTTNKFSIISIINWDTYQMNEKEINTQINKPLTNEQQTTNNKQECKEHKNEKNKEYPADFNLFYKSYPNKKSPSDALKTWNKLIGSLPSIEIILEAIENQKEWRENANGEFRPPWKHPATWLNKGCWEDDLSGGKSDKKEAWER